MRSMVERVFVQALEDAEDPLYRFAVPLPQRGRI
jgi:hypothetical protein